MEKSAHGLSRIWQNFKSTITNTFTSSMGIQQASMSLKPANTFGAHLRDSPRFTFKDSPRFTSEDSPRSSPFTAMHDNELSSEISDYDKKKIVSESIR